MSIFCTCCSKSKNREIGEMPAIRRYNSKRIERVYQAACELHLRFFILSGCFGLVQPEQCIPYYNHLLDPDEVSDLSKRVAEQIDRYGIGGIVYFTKPLASDANLVHYHAVLSAACSMLVRPFLSVQLEETDMNDWRRIMGEAEVAKATLISDRPAGEKEFESLLKRHPVDGMVYFKRGEAYEALKQNRLAASDFQRAFELFPMPDWKARAKEALNRVTH